MAMERPDARVVLVELNDDIGGDDAFRGVAAVLEGVHVTADGVRRVGNGAVPIAVAFGENVEVVTLERVNNTYRSYGDR